MAKEKLTTAQNIALKGLSLEEKLNLLNNWREANEISQSQFNFFSNLWISRESKKVMNTKRPLKKMAGENKLHCPKTIIEVEARQFLSLLQNRLNNYLAKRGDLPSLSENEQQQLERFLISPNTKEIKKQLLVIGLRYPDKRLNSTCQKYIATQKSLFIDNAFWVLLWSDGNLVPMDAIRLMLKKKGEEYVIDPVFEKQIIYILIPLIELQRNKEITRLKWAQSLRGEEREREVARKTRRLNAFNILLQAANKYVGN